MERTTFTSRLVEAAKAGYSGVVVQSPEPLRVEACAMQAAAALRYEFRRWSVTKGWTKTPDEDGKPGDPARDVQTIGTLPEKTVLVMHVFQEAFRDPFFRQGLRDMLAHAKTAQKTVVLVGTFDLPADLDKEVSSLEFDLPGRSEITTMARLICKSNGLDEPGDTELERAVSAALGLTSQEAENALALSLVRTRRLDPVTVLETKKEVVKRSGILEYLETAESLDTVGGLEYLKAWAVQRAQGFTQEAREFGLEPPKGMLLVGLPGCGKSLTAKALGAAWQVPVLRLDMGRVFGSLVGQSEQQLRQAIKTAEAVAPSILFIDEFEKATAGMGGGSSDGGTTQRVMGTLLTWMQDRSPDKPVFVVATANNVQALPPEMLRKGRWDEIFAVTLPTRVERMEIIRVHLTKRGRGTLATSDTLTRLVETTEGFTGSEIEETVKAGLWKAYARGEDLTVDDLLEAALEVVPLRETMAEQIEALMAWAKTRARAASRPEETGPARTRSIQLE